MEINLTSITLLVGHVFVMSGMLFNTIPSKKINWIYGYRHYLSIKNIGTWESAKRYSAQLMLIGGVAFLVIGLLTLYLPDTGVIGTVIAFALLIAFIIMLVITTEKHLKKLFDEDQKRKNVLR